MKPAHTCSIRVRELRSPIMGEFRGFRVLAAIPNSAARSFTGEPCTSYEKPFLLTVFGDYTTMDEVKANFVRILLTLDRAGFKKFNLEN